MECLVKTLTFAVGLGVVVCSSVVKSRDADEIIEMYNEQLRWDVENLDNIQGITDRWFDRFAEEFNLESYVGALIPTEYRNGTKCGGFWSPKLDRRFKVCFSDPEQRRMRDWFKGLINARTVYVNQGREECVSYLVTSGFMNSNSWLSDLHTDIRLNSNNALDLLSEKMFTLGRVIRDMNYYLSEFGPCIYNTVICSIRYCADMLFMITDGSFETFEREFSKEKRAVFLYAARELTLRIKELTTGITCIVENRCCQFISAKKGEVFKYSRALCDKLSCHGNYMNQSVRSYDQMTEAQFYDFLSVIDVINNQELIENYNRNEERSPNWNHINIDRHKRNTPAGSFLEGCSIQ